MSKTENSELGLQAVHKQWALWAIRQLRFSRPELIITLYGVDWTFTAHVANCPNELFPDLEVHFDRRIRPVTCDIKLSQCAPQIGSLIEEAISYETELWLNGEPLPAQTFNTLLFLAEPALPFGGIDFDNSRNTWVFRSFKSLTDEEQAFVQKAATKIGIVGPIDMVKVSPSDGSNPIGVGTPNKKHDLTLITSHRLKNSSSSLKNMVERDEDEWRFFLSQRAKQEILKPEVDTTQSFACLYDVEHCGESRLSELLTIYDRVDIMPPTVDGLDWYSKHQATLLDLQELVRLKRIRFILPHSIEHYHPLLIEAVAEVDRSSVILSRTLAAKTIVRGQKKEPLLYAPLTSSQRAGILSAISQSVADQKYRELLKIYGQLFSGQHDLFMMRGALASLGFGVGAYLGDVFLKRIQKDARLELGTCGAGIEWALGLGASYIPRNFGGYDETTNSQIIASYLGRTRIRPADPVTNRMHVVSEGLLAVSGVPPLDVAKNFNSLPALRFRNLAQKLMTTSPDTTELQVAIEKINADVRSFERRTERLSRWKFESLVAGVTVAAVQDSASMVAATSVISSWLYEVLENKIPAKFRNEIADAKHMLIGLATGSTLDAVVVSRSRKALTPK